MYLGIVLPMFQLDFSGFFINIKSFKVAPFEAKEEMESQLMLDYTLYLFQEFLNSPYINQLPFYDR